jgi:uncharacterized repeat protein (TIGR01451 family)
MAIGNGIGARSLARMFDGITNLRTLTTRRASTSKRRLKFESLEGRALMTANNLGAITGQVYHDATNNGFNAGEQVVGAQVSLYRDNGTTAGVFDAGDTLVGNDLTDATGVYRFDGLIAGGYFVRQVANVSLNLDQVTSSLVTVTAQQATLGKKGLDIDTFESTAQTATATFPTPLSAQTALVATEAIGGTRKLSVNLTSNEGTIGLRANQPTAPQMLTFAADDGAIGSRLITWDGDSSSPNTLNATGLGGKDLTQGGQNVGFLFKARTDQDNVTMIMRIYTDANNYSVATTTIPHASTLQGLYIPFSAFQVAGGTGANLANVGAVQVVINSDQTVEADGRIDDIYAVRPLDSPPQDFSNRVADPSIQKTVSNGSPQLNDIVTFTITVSNSGGEASTNTIVNDTWPQGLTYISSAATQGTYDPVTHQWTIGTLGARSGFDGNAAAMLSITAKVTTPGTITNIADVVSANDVNLLNNHATVPLKAQVPDPTVQKTVSDAEPGLNDTVTFTVTVSNLGDTAANTVVTDTWPQGLTYVSSTATQGNYDPTTRQWTIGTLAARAGFDGNAPVKLTITAKVTAQGTITNVVDVTSTNDVDLTNNHATVTLKADEPDPQIVKTVDNSSPQVNQNVTFTIKLSNSSDDAATNVVVDDTWPAGLTYVSSTADKGSYDPVTHKWTVGTLNGRTGFDGNAPVILTITAKVTSPSAITNIVDVTASNDIDLTNNHSTVTLTPQVIDLSVTKEVADTTPRKVNDNVTFRIILSNAGPNAATNVTLKDVLGPGLTFVSATPSQGTYDGATGIWNVGTVNAATAGVPSTLQLLVTAKITSSGPKVNTVQVQSADQFDIDSTPGNDVSTEDDWAQATVNPVVPVPVPAPPTLTKRLFLAR